jgi:hypothetical protein
MTPRESRDDDVSSFYFASCAMAFDERKIDRKRKRGAAGSSSIGASASGASKDPTTLAQQARDVASRLEADVDALADTFVWPPRKISDDTAVKNALERLTGLPVEAQKGASLRRWCCTFAARSNSELADDKSALLRLFTDRVGDNIGSECVGVESSFARSLDGGRYTHVLVDRARTAGSDVVVAHRDTVGTLEQSTRIVKKTKKSAQAKTYVVGVLLEDVSIVDAPTIVALGTENVPDKSSRHAYANAVKVPMTGKKNDVFAFEGHLLHAVLEPWSEPPPDSVSSRTRRASTTRAQNLYERWRTHVADKFVVLTSRDGATTSLKHARDRTIILMTVSPRTLASNAKLFNKVVCRQARQLNFERAPKRRE